MTEAVPRFVSRRANPRCVEPTVLDVFQEIPIMTVKVIAQPKKTTRPDGQTPVYPWLVDVPTDGGKD
jgi:hypothetical protein